MEAAKINYIEFLELMIKISCFGRNRLGATKNIENDNE